MNLSEWLSRTTQELENAGVTTARLDCLVLLEDILGKDRSWVLAHPDESLSSETVKILTQAIERRKAHEPLAYIRNTTEFYGRSFYVDTRVLEPRPESETMINLLKALPRSSQMKIYDIGTGSGALGITAKLELPDAAVTLVDISQDCLDVATRNADLLRVGVAIVKGDLAEPVKSADVLLCNLPYVPNDFGINQAAGHEPALALFGGADGLDVYRTLFTQLQTRTVTYVLTEALPFQHEELVSIAGRCGYELQTTDDFIQQYNKI